MGNLQIWGVRRLNREWIIPSMSARQKVFIQIAPSSRSGGSAGLEGKKHERPHLNPDQTSETCPVPQMSGPTTQTSFYTEQEGRQDKVRKTVPNPAQANVYMRNIPTQKKPDPNPRKSSKARRQPPKVQQII